MLPQWQQLDEERRRRKQQEQMRQQQEQIHKQQEQMHHQQEQARQQQQTVRQRMVYQVDQRRKKQGEKQKRDAVLLQAQYQTQSTQPDISYEFDERFAQVEAKAARLREDFGAGRLIEAQLKEKLTELMIQDNQGIWWMVGATSGEWYHHDGSNWIRAQIGIHSTVQKPEAPIKGTRRLWRAAIITLVIMMVLGLFLLIINLDGRSDERDLLNFVIGDGVLLGILVLVWHRYNVK